MTSVRNRSATDLNGICPYFTMFPLDFPLDVIRRRRANRGWVLDPFCGRGTTNFAARLCGVSSIGLDSNPLATAIARAKAAVTSAEAVISATERILRLASEPRSIPHGPFWRLAFHETTLRKLCVIREALRRSCRSQARIVLRAVVLGALHGPFNKRGTSYLSNQSPRTFAPKPRYAVRFWRTNGLLPPRVDILNVIRNRVARYLEPVYPNARTLVFTGDSRNRALFRDFPRVATIVTSPPYYGMKTYVADQWLRNWFLGGPPHVPYTHPSTQLSHSGPEAFANDLRSVWRNVALVAVDDAQLVCRFGGINDRNVDPRELIKTSLGDSGWRITTIRSAGTASDGRRQARQFTLRTSVPKQELDLYAIRD
jgi:DNA methylase